MLGRGGNEEAARAFLRSGDGRMHMCGLRDEGRTGGITSKVIILHTRVSRSPEVT